MAAVFDAAALAGVAFGRAGFQAMVFRTGRWHLGEDAWPEDWRATH